MAGLGALQERLGYAFRDEALLRLALTHPSVTHELGRQAEHNQRLEFLGDAVIQLTLTRELYDKFPKDGEGPLTKARARLVNRRALAVRGRQLGLGRHLRLSRGEELHGGRERPSALADAYEAVVGAVFVDGGFEAAREFLRREFGEMLRSLETLPSIDNPKGELQELLQADSSEPPSYTIVATSGPDHDRSFECIVRHREVELARGSGKSKKAAESEAALAALQALREAGRTAAPSAAPTPARPAKTDAG